MIDGESRLPGHVFESAVSTIPVQDISVDARDKDVRVTVVVIVGGSHRHRVANACDARLFGNIREGQVGVVLVEPVVECGTSLATRGDVGSVGEVDVKAAVI